MSMCAKPGCADECFYCESPTKRHEHDHAPVPRRVGGVDIVTACPTCHHFKDRVTFERWPLKMQIDAIGELIELDALPTLEASFEWPRQWDGMSTEARWLWARWTATIHHAGVIGIRQNINHVAT